MRKTDLIDKTTKEIKQDDDKVVYKTLEEIGDDLPDHSPRFVLLSYPLTLVRLRFKLPSTVDLSMTLRHPSISLGLVKRRRTYRRGKVS